MFLFGAVDPQSRRGAGSGVGREGLAAATISRVARDLDREVGSYQTGQLRITTAISSFALAIRQVEIGLASMVSLLFGLTVNVYGVVLPVDSTYPKWLGGLAIVGGVPTMIAGVLVAYTGFSCCWLGCSQLASSCGGEAEFSWMKLRSDNRMKTTLVALAAYTER